MSCEAAAGHDVRERLVVAVERAVGRQRHAHGGDPRASRAACRFLVDLDVIPTIQSVAASRSARRRAKSTKHEPCLVSRCPACDLSGAGSRSEASALGRRKAWITVTSLGTSWAAIRGAREQARPRHAQSHQQFAGRSGARHGYWSQVYWHLTEGWRGSCVAEGQPGGLRPGGGTAHGPSNR